VTSPDALLDASRVGELRDRVSVIADQLLSAEALEILFAGLTETLAAELGLEPSANARIDVENFSLEGNGYARLVRRCAGPTGSAPLDEDHGSVTLTATVSDGGIGSTIWGEARACQDAVDGHGVIFEGTVILAFAGLPASLTGDQIILT
jgi:hypothetical protein